MSRNYGFNCMHVERLFFFGLLSFASLVSCNKLLFDFIQVFVWRKRHQVECQLRNVHNNESRVSNVKGTVSWLSLVDFTKLCQIFPVKLNISDVTMDLSDKTIASLQAHFLPGVMFKGLKQVFSALLAVFQKAHIAIRFNLLKFLSICCFVCIHCVIEMLLHCFKWLVLNAIP